MPADPGRESQEDILASALAALTVADIPADDAWTVPDPDTSRPAELAGLATVELDELAAAAPPPVPEVLPAGCLPRDGSGRGSGFADGGPLDTLTAGATLGGLADDAHYRLGSLSDDELIGVLRAWRRQASWAQARELAAVTELARRRPGPRARPAAPGELPEILSEFLDDEVAMALTLTRCAAGHLVGLALDLHGRRATAAALEAGRIDLRKARLILDSLRPLSLAHAATVEALVLPDAPGLTTGQLRAALARAVLALDPDAVRRRREEAEKSARVECWTDSEGTATLAGKSLPPAEVLAADKRLCQVAAWWKRQIRAAWKRADPYGRRARPEHGTDLLRARAYLALLLGQPLDTPADLLPPTAPDAAGVTPDRSRTAGSDGAVGPDGSGHPDSPGHPDGPGHPDSPGGRELPPGFRSPDPPGGNRPSDPFRPYVGDPVAGLPPLAGLISLTIPLTTLMRLTDSPGDVPGLGPVEADTARQLACALAGHRATRWQVIITAPDGTALATGTHRGPARTTSTAARPPGTATTPPDSGGAPPGTSTAPSGAPGPPGSGWTIAVTAEPIATGSCDHRNAEPGYRPSPGLQRLIRARTTTCCGPGCRRPASRADIDHTLPYDRGGITCECNGAPGCRNCHRRKQASGWTLQQPRPGVMIWTSPAGRRYTTYPSKHPT